MGQPARNGGPPPLKIGELARRVGLTPRTIRYYEDIGLLNSVRRVEGGRRIYTDDDVRRLKFIKRLKLLGLSLEEMKELEELYRTHRSNEKVLPRLLELLDHHLEEIEHRIDQLRMLQRDIEAYREHIRSKL
ncbi:MerR family transcriptional regulator [Deferrisoma camini]|uniref:MerR family transcriptional regulator n=1 Tax=Deferrisoma camini TaxID=1035120 RepID=UPI00046D544F|nr:MerR family transcriptional regulator [Deferrisoma camini]NOY46387.1 MerR family transcriptional regulator [Deltaproteobacteria bacterium]